MYLRHPEACPAAEGVAAEPRGPRADPVPYVLSESPTQSTAWNSVYPARQDKGASCKGLD